jgi:hypothetical protein
LAGGSDGDAEPDPPAPTPEPAINGWSRIG